MSTPVSWLIATLRDRRLLVNAVAYSCCAYSRLCSERRAWGTFCFDMYLVKLSKQDWQDRRSFVVVDSYGVVRTSARQLCFWWRVV